MTDLTLGRLEPPRSSAWRLTPVRLRSGEQAGLLSWTEPLIHVASGQPVGFRFARMLWSSAGRPLTALERDRLPPGEAADYDAATVGLLQTDLAQDPDGKGLALLPLGFMGLANPSARLRLASVLGVFSDQARKRTAVEIEDLAVGTPRERIMEAVNFVRPYCRAVVVRTPPIRAALEGLRGAGLRGVSLDASGLDSKPGEVFGRLKLLRDRSRNIAPDVFALGLADETMADLAISAGAALISLRPERQVLAQTG
jgi:hypothetical protein